jgi:hypothetical protein
MAKSYFEKLKDPRWQRRRLEAMEGAEFRCQLCHDDKSTLHVHHKGYLKGRDPWEYDLEQLAVICESCHSLEHSGDDPYTYVGTFLPIDGPSCRRDAAVLVCGAMLYADLEHEMVQKLFPEPWPFLKYQLALGRVVDALEWVIGDGDELPEILTLSRCIHKDPQGFKSLIREFVRNTPTR